MTAPEAYHQRPHYQQEDPRSYLLRRRLACRRRRAAEGPLLTGIAPNARKTVSSSGEWRLRRFAFSRGADNLESGNEPIV